MRVSIAQSIASFSGWNQQYRILTGSGALKWVQGRAAPRRSVNGDVTFTTISVDITESKTTAASKMRVLEKSVHALAAVMEARDPYTAGHEEKVSEISVKIAKKMGLPAKKIEGLELAAMTHDVGKTSIPAEILG